MQDSIGLPYPPYLWIVVRHSVVMWLLLRLMVFALAAGGGLSAALHPAGTTRVLLMVLTAFLVWWDRRRSHELLLHGNLGAWPGWFWVASLLTAAVLDGATQTLLGVI